MAQVTTSHFEIAKYWRDKFILPNGEITNLFEEGAIPVIIDIGEPCCWGCDRPVIGEAEKKRISTEENEVYLQKIWKDPTVKSKYERCHIIPGALGGEDKPENLFLMCEQCHFESPDTTNPKSFFRWVYSQRMKYVGGKLSPWYTIDKVSEELKRRGLVSVEELLSYNPNFLSIGQDLEEYMKHHVGLHCTHCSDSSLICGVADWIMKNFIQSSLR